MVLAAQGDLDGAVEARDLLAAEWGVTKNDRRARYYELTPAGRAALRAESAALLDQFDAMTVVLTARSARG